MVLFKNILLYDYIHWKTAEPDFEINIIDIFDIWYKRLSTCAYVRPNR